MVADDASLGDIIRRQRELSELSMRQFAQMVGISNPYLSQIERGLREPSEKVVEAIAESLHLSADTLFEQAGIAADEEEPQASAVIEAIRADRALSARQRRAMIEVYEAFTAQKGATRTRRRRRRAPAE